MSFEGYYQCVCEKEHIWNAPYNYAIGGLDEGEKCDDCGGSVVFWNRVDDTNCDEYGKMSAQDLITALRQSPPPTQQTKVAQPVDAMVVRSLEHIEGITIATVDCADYEALSRLPQVVRVDGRFLGRSGWNSDQRIAYYRSDVSLAFPVR